MTAFSPSFKKSIEERIKNGAVSESMRSMQALGRMKSGKMNKTEIAYSQHLEALKACGEIVWWKFEAIKLRLADNTFYTVDFFVMKSSGEISAHEVKGFMLDDANVKIKVAAEMYPFRFFLIRKRKKHHGQWDIKEIGNGN